MEIQENVALKEYTTMKVGGNARFFCVAQSVSDVQEACYFAEPKNIPVFVLGGGSNIIFDDEGYQGLVMKIDISSVSYEERGDAVYVQAGAGVVWDELVEEVVQKNLCGFENLSLIPGTVGASVVQNIGAYGVEIESMVDRVHAYNTHTKKIVELSRDECAFEYRHSIFKTKKGKDLVVLSVTYVLRKEGQVNTSYGSLDMALKEKNVTHPTVQDMRDVVCDIRRAKLPYQKNLGSAGSFFKNPTVSKKESVTLQEKYQNIPMFPVGDSRIKIPAGWIIDNVCKLKSYREGDIGVYDKQALVIVNYGNASSGDVKKLAEKIQQCVKEKTGIMLEREVEYVQKK